MFFDLSTDKLLDTQESIAVRAAGTHRFHMSQSDSILQAALDRIQELVRERNELEAFVATFRKLQTSSAKPAEPLPPPKSPPSPTNPPSATTTIIDAAMAALAKNGGPMKLGELHDAVLALGVQIGGKNPKNNLGAKLSADFRLVTHKDFGWWFASDPIPEKYRIEEYCENERGSTAVEPLQSNGAAVSPAPHQPEF